MPARPADLDRQGAKVVHSVRDDDRWPEAEVRDYFMRVRQRERPGAELHHLS